MTTDTITVDGRAFAVEIRPDECMGAPWDEHDGHGPVSDWRQLNHFGHFPKEPGERMLDNDGRGRAMFYDLSEAIRMARREGWGFLPGELVTRQDSTGRWIAETQSPAFSGRAVADEINTAISALHAQHRATYPSARAYHAAAAVADMERLRRWCEGDWYWCVVCVSPICPTCDEPDHSRMATLGGIESDAGDYLEDVARELAAEIIEGERRAA